MASQYESQYSQAGDLFHTPREFQRIASHPIAFESETPLRLSPAHYPSPDVPQNTGYYDQILRSARSETGAAALGSAGAGSPESGYGKPGDVVRASMPSASGNGHGSPLYTSAGGGSGAAPLAPKDAALTSTSVDVLSKRMNLGGYLVNPTPTTSVFPTPAASANPTPASSVRPSPQTTPLKLPKWATGLNLSSRNNNGPTNSRAKRTMAGAFGSTDEASIVIPPQQADLRPTPLASDNARQVLGNLSQNRADDGSQTYSLAQAQAAAAAAAKSAALRSPEAQDISDSSVLYSGSTPGYASAHSSPEHLQSSARRTGALSSGVPHLQPSDTPLVPATSTGVTRASSPSTGERGVGYWAQRADYWHGRAKMHTETSQQFLPGSLAGLLAMPRVEGAPNPAPSTTWPARKQLSQSLDTDALKLAALRTTPLKAGDGPVQLQHPREPTPHATPPPSSPQQYRHVSGSSVRSAQGLAREDMPLKALPAPQPSPDPVVTPPRSNTGKGAQALGEGGQSGSSMGTPLSGVEANRISSENLSAVVSSVAKIKESLRSSQEAGGTLSPDYCNALESELGKLQECLETFRQSSDQQVGGDKAAGTTLAVASAAETSSPVPEPTTESHSAQPSSTTAASVVPRSSPKVHKTPTATSMSPPAKSVGCFACVFLSKNKYQQK